MNAIEWHTPLPWGIEQTCDDIWIGPVGRDGKVDAIAVSIDTEGLKQSAIARHDADAALIVRSVNSHAELVEALETFVTEAESFHNTHHGSTTVDCDTLCGAIAPAKTALAKAKGEQ